ncbi:PREDICTED: uncharacterized protein LOC101299325 [Fragaria vesca subsp. vesca]|uniref:uncharacterized protein LOC101299325 n=1 Tax=Fragaria vesca subsp. vesca TaxID=101020 RepID=UPI0002C2DF82|nr:PREDICTED: uncharacterized protein LOC101299325 [Fragaria vesca subsp. vesca]
MWTIFKKIGRNIKYLSSEAKAQRPHGNLLKGTGITPDLQALFLNLGADDTDPMLYKKDVKDLHQLLSSFKLKKVTTAKLTKEQQIITDCVDRWISFLSDTCLQDPVPKKWTIVLGTAIDPPYLNHDHVRLIFNYPASWSSTEELRFLANMYKLCSGEKSATNLARNADFEKHLMECNYQNWDACITSPLLYNVYDFGRKTLYLDHTGRLIINSFVLFAYNCIKHYDGTAQKSHTQEEILAELHKQFPNFTEVIYQAFYKAVAKGYKHSEYSIEQILTERI